MERWNAFLTSLPSLPMFCLNMRRRVTDNGEPPPKWKQTLLQYGIAVAVGLTSGLSTGGVILWAKWESLNTRMEYTERALGKIGNWKDEHDIRHRAIPDHWRDK